MTFNNPLIIFAVAACRPWCSLHPVRVVSYDNWLKCDYNWIHERSVDFQFLYEAVFQHENLPTGKLLISCKSPVWNMSYFIENIHG